jgi:hypothetical protein
MNLFRNILPGELAFDGGITPYKFVIQNSLPARQFW